ncbi:MAG TPA: hypothetical protein VG796_00080 [Verrucomicrobiales bacterium]|jgi:hypothetical protein|nr:hypothetical protein [Verrucomicrobiales bacterium]
MLSAAQQLIVIDNESGNRLAGVSLRKTNEGPEKDLVEWFLANLPFTAGKGNQLTIFREPRLLSGIPDLVLVEWDMAVAAHWNSRRKDVKFQDLKLAHHLATAGPCTRSMLSKLGIPRIDGSLERLKQSGIVRVTRKDYWQLKCAINRLFAVRRIIAVEAKIADTKRALKQAFLNTWFSCASYVLLPSDPKWTILKTAAQLNIGVVSRSAGGVCAPVSSRQRKGPKSLGAWLFNEWAWKASFVGAG